MGCAASKAPPKRDPVEELIEEVHAQQGRESGGGVTLDLSAAPAGADAPAGRGGSGPRSMLSPRRPRRTAAGSGGSVIRGGDNLSFGGSIVAIGRVADWLRTNGAC